MSLFTRRGDNGIFDEIFSWIETLRANDLYIFGLEELAFAVEGVLQDIDDLQIHQAVKNAMAFWLQIVRLNNSEKSTIEAFQVQVLRTLEVLSDWTKPTSQLVESKLKSIQPQPPEDWVPNDPNEQSDHSMKVQFTSQHALIDDVSSRLSQPSFVKTVIERLTSGAQSLMDMESSSKGNSSYISLVKDVFLKVEDLDRDGLSDIVGANDNTEIPRRFFPIWRAQEVSERKATIENATYEWTIDLRFVSVRPSASAIGHTLWAFGTALESVKGVAVVIENWQMGSLLARIRVYIRNIWARDEVREVLDKGRKATVAHYLDKPNEEVRKIKAEREKLEEEKRQLEQNRESKSNLVELQKELLELQVEEKKTDIHSKKLDNKLKEMEVLQRASSLIKDGIISADQVAIDVNGTCYFLCNGNEIDRGEDIRVIEAKGKMVGNDLPPSLENNATPPETE